MELLFRLIARRLDSGAAQRSQSRGGVRLGSGMPTVVREGVRSLSLVGCLLERSCGELRLLWCCGPLSSGTALPSHRSSSPPLLISPSPSPPSAHCCVRARAGVEDYFPRLPCCPLRLFCIFAPLCPMCLQSCVNTTAARQPHLRTSGAA